MSFGGLRSLLFIALLGVPLHAAAYVCKEGDSLPALAQLLYGSDGAAVYIGAANNLGKTALCKAGQKIVLPTATSYKIKRGDRLELLAKQFLGDKRRALALAQLNNMKLNDKLREGQEISIPFLHSHRAEAPESVSAIAKQYYGDASRGRLVAEFNYRQAPVVPKGERVLVPIVALRLRPIKVPTGKVARALATLPPAEATRRLEESAARVVTALDQSRKLHGEGQYGEALLRLDRALQEELATEEQLVVALELRATLLVSLGLDELAVGVFRDLHQRKNDFVCDEATTSPKVCAAWEQAKATPTVSKSQP